MIELDSQPAVGNGSAEEVEVPVLWEDTIMRMNRIPSSGYSSSPYASTQPVYESYQIRTIPLGPEPQLTLERRGELLFQRRHDLLATMAELRELPS